MLNTPALANPEDAGHATTPDEVYRAIFKKERPTDTGTTVVTVDGSSMVAIGSLLKAATVADMSDDAEVAKQLRAEAEKMPKRKRRIVVNSEEVAGLRRENAELKNKLADALQKIGHLEQLNMRQERELNRHCTTDLDTAIDDFKTGKTDVSEASLGRYVAALEDLRLYLGCRDNNAKNYAALTLDPECAEATRMAEAGGKFKVADLRGHHLDDFLSARPDKKTGEPITEKRKAAMARELSAPYNFWKRRYELTFNAFDHVQPLTGHQATAPDSREMIRTVADLKRLLWALGQEDEHAVYWQTFIATATLTGADLGQLFDLEPSDVILEEPTRIIMCRAKTGKQRDTPIERTLLLPLLEKYRKTAKEKFLFPSLLAEGLKKRKKTAAGRWSGASAFSTVWSDVAERCKARVMKHYKLDGRAAEFCCYTARAWRRTAVTMMNGAGCLPGQVSRWVGHSVAIADRHYLGKVERNGLVFESK